MNAIIGRLVATANAKYLPEHDKEKGKYILHRNALQMKIQHAMAVQNDISEEAMLDCVKQLEAMGTFQELRNEQGYQDEEGQKHTGLVIVSEIDPRISMVVDFGSKWHNDSDYFWLNRDLIDVTLKFFADVNHEKENSGMGSVPERKVSPEELDLISKLREKSESKQFTGQRVTDILRTQKLSESKNQERKALTEAVVQETGEADQDYDQALYDAICKHLKAAGLKCSHREFDKYQGVVISLPTVGKRGMNLWTVDSFVTGKTKPSKAKYRSAKLIDADGSYSANAGDYFQMGAKDKFKDMDLILVHRDGTEEIIHEPMKSQLPDLLDVQFGVEYEGTPDDVLVLQPEGFDETFEVVVSKGEVVADSNLTKFLKKESKGKSMKESFYEDFELVDKFGMPLTEETVVKSAPVKDSDIMPKSPEKKEKEVEKKAASLAELSAPTPVGKQIAGSSKPVALPGAGKDSDEKAGSASDLKVGKPGDEDGKGEHMEAHGKAEDPQKELAAADLKVGKPGEDHGKHVSESADWRKLMRESVELSRKLVEVRSRLRLNEGYKAHLKEMGAKLAAKKVAQKPKMGELSKPAEKMEAKDLSKEAAKKAHLAKIREKMKAKKKA